MTSSNTNIFIIPIIATTLFCISKFIEMKFIDKELKPLKFIIRDASIVFISVLSSTYVFFYMNGSLHEFMNVITDTKVSTPSILGKGGEPAEIFTDTPNF
jgi:hypothetical protein